MFDPSAPDTKREIRLTYVTDADGEMEISIDTEGFEEDPRAVALFLSATLAVLSDPHKG